jgi:hypothetical protein
VLVGVPDADGRETVTESVLVPSSVTDDELRSLVIVTLVDPVPSGVAVPLGVAVADRLADRERDAVTDVSAVVVSVSVPLRDEVWEALAEKDIDVLDVAVAVVSRDGVVVLLTVAVPSAVAVTENVADAVSLRDAELVADLPGVGVAVSVSADSELDPVSVAVTESLADASAEYDNDSDEEPDAVDVSEENDVCDDERDTELLWVHEDVNDALPDADCDIVAASLIVED